MDYNDDGKKDILTGESYDGGNIRIYLNTGTDASPTFSNTYTNLQAGGSAFACGYYDGPSYYGSQIMPHVCDWNNDGLSDVLAGCILGHLHLMINTGSAGSPSFAADVTLTTQGGSTINPGWRASPVVFDYDADGKKDIVVGNDSGLVRLLKNVGTDAAPAFDSTSGVGLSAGGVQIDVGSYARLDVVDWDADGVLDIIAGAFDGRVRWFRRHLPNESPILDPVGNKSVDENSTLAFTLTGSDPDNNLPLTYGATGLPPGATLNASTGAFSWTPGWEDQGSHTVTFTVTDSLLASDSEVITITVNDIDSDTDGDGDPNSSDPDDDNDGLSDADEGARSPPTDPLNPDSDGDGLSDGSEVNTHFTDPMDPDSDGDGHTDGVEVAFGSNPRDATSVPNLARGGLACLPGGGERAAAPLAAMLLSLAALGIVVGAMKRRSARP